MERLSQDVENQAWAFSFEGAASIEGAASRVAQAPPEIKWERQVNDHPVVRENRIAPFEVTFRLTPDPWLTMLSTLLLVVSTLRIALGRRADLLLEIAALRHQAEVLRGQVLRPRLQRRDRMFWIWL